MNGGLNTYGYVGEYAEVVDPWGLQAKHTNNAHPSTQEKHQNAEARRSQEQGGEKGDKRREYNNSKRLKSWKALGHLKL